MTRPVNALTLIGPTKTFTDVKQIPPTKTALEQHAMRAVYQGGHVWGQGLPGRSRIGSGTACLHLPSAFANQLGVEENRGWSV